MSRDKGEMYDWVSVNSIGVVTRCFARTKKDVDLRVQSVQKLLARLELVRVCNLTPFSRYDVMVWNTDDPKSDCGDTYPAMRRGIHNLITQKVTEVKVGGLFDHILNVGLVKQLAAGMRYTLVISSEAGGYITNETLTEMVRALMKGALVVGVAINEYCDNILGGMIENTAAIWDNQALLAVGGMDATLPVQRETLDRLRDDLGYDPETIEEIRPIVRLIRTYTDQHVIASVLPSGDGVPSYTPLRNSDDVELLCRQRDKARTKLARQSFALEMNQMTMEELQAAILPGFGLDQLD